MLTIFCIVIGIAAAAFLFSVILGRPSRDEPIKPVVEDHETFWTKPANK
jgi:hypothetical protein